MHINKLGNLVFAYKYVERVGLPSFARLSRYEGKSQHKRSTYIFENKRNIILSCCYFNYSSWSLNGYIK